VVGFPLFIVWIGLLYFFRFKREPVQINPETVSGVSGGLLYVAGSGFMLIQACIALVKTGFQASFGVTAIFILIPLIFGFLILRYMVKPVRYQGIKLLLLGALGLVVWAGYVAGPVLVIFSGLLILFKRRGRAKQP
jgi:hypothetical protein